MVFTLFMSVPGWFRIENAALPWYQRGPEHWVWPLQCVVCGAVLAFFWRHYEFKPWRGLGLAVLLGCMGIVCWIAPNIIFHHYSLTEGWWKHLGVMDRPDGFDPTILDSHPAGKTASIFMRFVRMVVIVPLVEELFWRGFLMRYIVAEKRGIDWRRVPFGTHHWLSFVIVTTGVTIIHNTEDWAAAFVWGALMYWLAVRTKSLGACVVMHAVGNLILGIYVLQTRQWGFW